MTVQTVSISEFHFRQSDILSMLQQTPVYLTEHSKTSAVLVSVDQWQQMTTRLRNLELLALVNQCRAEIDKDPIGELISDEELERQIAAKVAAANKDHIS